MARTLTPLRSSRAGSSTSSVRWRRAMRLSRLLVGLVGLPKELALRRHEGLQRVGLRQASPGRQVLPADLLAIQVDHRSAVVAQGKLERFHHRRIRDQEPAPKADPGDKGRMALHPRRPAQPVRVVELRLGPACRGRRVSPLSQKDFG